MPQSVLQPEPPIRQGTIVQVVIDKRRPAVVYTPDDLIASSEELDVAGISGSYYPDDPDQIPLPYHKGATTRLTKPSSIQLNLLKTVKKADVLPSRAFVGKGEMAELLKKLRERGLA